MRTGKLYKFILGNSELSPSLKAVFQSWLDSAAKQFPKMEDIMERKRMRTERGRRTFNPSLQFRREAEDWFNKYLGHSIKETVTEEEEK